MKREETETNARILQLIERSKESRASAPEKSLQFALEAATLLTKSDSAGMTASHECRNLLVLHAEEAMHRGNTESALELVMKAFGLQDGDREDPVLFQLLSSLHGLSGSYAEAFTLAQKALDAARKVGDSIAEASAWNHLGILHNRSAEYAREIECYKKRLNATKTP
jgi:tetratricopeptide (TPR) repeat protein